MPCCSKARTVFRFIAPLGHDMFVGNESKESEIISFLQVAGILNRCQNACDLRVLVIVPQRIIYLLHVRGFSNHSSSKVKNKGTIQGILQKTDYLKELRTKGHAIILSTHIFSVAEEATTLVKVV